MTNNTVSKARLYWLHTITSLHVGAGRGAGAIDLPLVRERATQWPYVPGSGVKGVLASLHRAADAGSREGNNALAFGKQPADTTDVSESAGSLVFCDARLLCLPVRSLIGTFAWVTCPLALQRLTDDWQRAGVKGLPALPSLAVDKAACVCVLEQCQLIPKPTDNNKDNKTEPKNTIYLEDLDLEAVDCPLTASWADKLATALAIDPASFKQRLVVVHNDVFQFLCTTALEVRARIGIDSASKTVKDGALWYEEALPSESILYGLVWCDRVFDGKEATQVTAERLLEQYCQGEVTLQMGGKASTGKGMVRAVGLSPAKA